MAFAPDVFTGFTRSGVVPDRLTRVKNSQSFAFRCADNTLLTIHLSTQEKFWNGLLKALNANELATDPRFVGHRKRAENYLSLRDELSARFLNGLRVDWLQRLTDADVPAAPIWNVSEALKDVQVAALGSVCETEHPTRGIVRSIACPILVDGERPRRLMSAPPALGEHTQEVLDQLKEKSSNAR